MSGLPIIWSKEGIAVFSNVPACIKNRKDIPSYYWSDS